MARPPFTGKHEISTASAEKGPHEGSILSPYGEDLFQRIVDINFGGSVGAVFTSGDTCCYLRYASIPTLTLKQDWLGLGSLMFGDGGGSYGSSYAIVNGMPTFLMSGQGNNNGTGWGGIVAISHDAKGWATVLYDPTFGYGAVHDLVWDPRDKAFYGHTNGPTLVSKNGYFWDFSPDDFYEHCIYGVPDGIVGFDPDTETAIYPDELTNDNFYCNCTAFCGGIWLAGGELGGGDSATFSSIDGGENWDIVTAGPIGMTGNYDVLCISGAPIGDFKK